MSLPLLRIHSNLYYNQPSNYFCKRRRRHWLLVHAGKSRKPNKSVGPVWNLRFFIAVNIPYFCPLCLRFSIFGSRLSMGCEKFTSWSPLLSLSGTYTWFIVFKVRVSHRTFSLPTFLPVCCPDKGAVQVEANWRVTAAIPESREVGGYQLSHSSPRLCPEIHRTSSVPIADPRAVTSSSANFDLRLRHAAKPRTWTRFVVHSISE